MNASKILSLGVLTLALSLSACNEQQPADKQTPPTPATETAPNPQASTHDHDDHEHDNHEGHDHDHHHEHNHAHDQGDAYQCGNETIHIAVHNHDGEIEAHLTKDSITYDLNEDVQTKGRFTTDDGISGEDKGMALVLDGNKATVTTLDNQTLLDCTKK